MSQPTRVFDLAVAGAGAAGLALAAAVRQALGAGVSVAVIDPAPRPSDKRDPAAIRTVAIAEGPRRLLDEIGAWMEIEPEAEAVLSMEIMDGGVRDAIRPTHLTFGGGEGEPLAYMAFNDDVVSALARVCERLGVERIRKAVTGWRPGRATGELALAGGETVRARLAVAADGARSKLAKLAGVHVVGWDYDQSGLVATIVHERDHDGRAEQHFLPAGPFAILPLPGRRSSIVWNETRADATRIVKLGPEDLMRQLEPRFTARLGEIRLDSRVEAFPFRFQIARWFAAERLALVGDAAHVVHPLAGQGLNLGLRDVAALAETVVKTMRLGLDPGAAAPLAEYQRARRFDVAASGLGMDAMNRLFSNDIAPLRFVRDLGLRLVDRTPRLKHMLVEEAGGIGQGAPRLLQGFPL